MKQALVKSSRIRQPSSDLDLSAVDPSSDADLGSVDPSCDIDLSSLDPSNDVDSSTPGVKHRLGISSRSSSALNSVL